MSDQSSRPIEIFFPKTEITVEPGESDTLQFYLFNGQAEDDEFRIILEGVPSSWVSNANPRVSLPSGSRTRIDLIFHPPEATTLAGKHQFTVRVISKNAPENTVESGGVLVVSALDTPAEGAMRLFLSSTQFEVQPGGSAHIAVTLLNRGNEEDRFRLTVEGVPANWVFISDPDLRLSPQEQVDISITIQPPRLPRARAGLYPVVIRATSRRAPQQSTEVNASLSVAGLTRTGKGRIGLFLWSTDVSVAPGANTSIPILLVNEGEENDSFQVFVEGAPAGWVTPPPPITHLAPGDQQEVKLDVQLPQTPTGKAGKYPLVVRVVSLSAPDDTAEFDASLTVAAFRVDTTGPIGAYIWTTQYPVAPGGQVEIALSVLNNGRNNDLFTLSVDGMPSDWVVLPEPLPLAPQEQAQVTLTIQPPRSAKSRAGRYPFSIQINSRQAPGQHVTLECTLTVGAFSQFSSELQPQQFADDHIAKIIVRNLGNIQQAFTVWWQSENNSVSFEPDQPQSVRVPAGDSSAVEFRARPSVQPIFGGEKNYPFSAFVQAGNQETQSMSGDVISRGRIPIWIIPIILVFCCAVIFAFGIFLQQVRIQGGVSGTQTVVAEETSIAGTVTAAIGAEETGTAAINQTDVAATMTAATPTPSETPTPTVTGTLEPSLTPTETPLTPSVTPTETPTETPVTPTETPVTPSVTPTETPTETPEPTDAPPLGGTGVLAMSSNRDGDAEIYAFTIADNSVTKLTDNNAIDTEPSWNPSANQLVFTSNREGNNDIYAMNADGSLQTNLTNDGASDLAPDWAPNNTRIAFASDRFGNWEILSMNTDGSDVLQLSNDGGEDLYPAWSPDSSKIAFASDRVGNREIFVMNADGSDQTNLTQAGGDDTYPTWSPDGSRIAFASNRNGDWDVFVMNSDGTNQTALNTGLSGSDMFGLDWSPDGQVIVFTSNDNGNQEIYAVRPDGSELQNLTNDGGQDAYPAWKPQ